MIHILCQYPTLAALGLCCYVDRCILTPGVYVSRRLLFGTGRVLGSCPLKLAKTLVQFRFGIRLDALSLRPQRPPFMPRALLPVIPAYKYLSQNRPPGTGLSTSTMAPGFHRSLTFYPVFPDRHSWPRVLRSFLAEFPAEFASRLRCGCYVVLWDPEWWQ